MKVEDMEVFIAFLQMIPFYLLLDIVSHSKRYVFIENLKDRIQKIMCIVLAIHGRTIFLAIP